jgi:hypothetical protein
LYGQVKTHLAQPEELRLQTPAWPDDQYKRFIRVLEKDTILTAKNLPQSVWEEVKRRDNAKSVLTTMFRHLTTSTRSLKPWATSSLKITDQITNPESLWVASACQIAKSYHSIETAERDISPNDCDISFAREYSPGPYGGNCTSQQLLKWFEENGISNLAASDLLKIISSGSFAPADVPRISSHSFRRDLQHAALGMVHEVDLGVPADGDQKVIFYYRHPVEVLQWVSAHSSQGTLVAHLSAPGTTQYVGSQCSR